MTSPYSPRQMQSGTAMADNANDPVNLGDARALPDLGEAESAVAAGFGDRGVREVQQQPNMSYPGTHVAGE